MYLHVAHPGRMIKYHTTIFKVPHRPLQSTTPPSSKYHTILFNVPHVYTTIFKVPNHQIKIPRHPLKSITFHVHTVFKVSHTCGYFDPYISR